MPGDARVLYRLGEAYLDDGDLQSALVAFERAFAAAPVAELAYQLGFVHDQLAHQAEAIEWFERALALDAGHANARAYLGMLKKSQR